MTDSRKPIGHLFQQVEEPEVRLSNTHETDSKAAQVGREALKIGIIGGGVAGLMLGPNMALQSLQTMGAQSAKSNASHLLQRGSLFATARTIARGYRSAATASTIKGGLVAEREHVDGLIKHVSAEKEVVVEEKEGILNTKDTTLETSLGRMALVSGFLGGADTLFTNRPRNFQTWSCHAAMNPGYPVPAPSTLLQHMDASMLGFSLRCAANVISLGGFLAITPIKNALGNNLPVYSYADLNNIAATAASALVVGPITNALAGVWYTNYVLSIDPVTFKPRKMIDVARDLIAKEGKLVMFKGVKTSVIVTGFTSAAVNNMEGIANRFAPIIESNFLYCMDRLFKKEDVTKTKSATPAESLKSNQYTPGK